MSCLESRVNNDVALRRESDPLTLWFAVYTSHRHEKHVSELLEERGIETVLPLYKVVRHWKKSAPVVLELPLFPCYLFVHLDRCARSSVLGLPGVLSIVGSPNEPWPLPTSEVEALRLGIRLAKLQPYPYLTVGDRVRIKSGPMSGVEGILARKNNELRCVLTLEALMRSVVVEVDAKDLEIIDQPGRARDHHASPGGDNRRQSVRLMQPSDCGSA